MGAVVDVEFDDMEGVPDILNALHVKVGVVQQCFKGGRAGLLCVHTAHCSAAALANSCFAACERLLMDGALFSFPLVGE